MDVPDLSFVIPVYNGGKTIGPVVQQIRDLFADLAIEVVLVNDRIENFLEAFRLSQRSRRVIKQNLVISLGTVALMALASLTGQVPLSLGVFVHEGSTVIVCLNSLRLLFWRSKD